MASVTASSLQQPLWQPTPAEVENAEMTAFMRAVEKQWRVSLPDYPALYQWSIAEPERFWRSIWSFCGVVAQTQGHLAVQDRDQMPGARWFPQARLNFAQNLLRRRDDGIAIVFRGEDRVESQLTHAELYAEVSRLAQALRAAGVRSGDRVAAYVPNLPGAVIAMLAASSIGAIWSSCSPDFGVQGVLDRFGQIDP